MKKRGWSKKQIIIIVIIALIAFAIGVLVPDYVRDSYEKVPLAGELPSFPDPDRLPPDYEECTDTDDGVDAYTKGTVVGLAGDMRMTEDTDYCVSGEVHGSSSEYLVEWYCKVDDDTGISFRTNTNYECVGGCENGACVEGFIYGTCDLFDATSCTCQISALTRYWLVGCSGTSGDYCPDYICGCADVNEDGCVNLQDFSEIMDTCSGDLAIEPIC